ncbi:MAG: hypothetical protein J6N22_06815, partial [Schwartzia sp.]|nr:hypothetical protein [Schwartzia sp. (in: firmicutes)]
KVDEKQRDIDNAARTFEDRLDPAGAQRRAESDLALAKMYEAAAAENLNKVSQDNTPEARAAIEQARKEYDRAKENTRQAMIAAGKASMLSKYDADAELSKLKAQQAKEQAANEQAARQGEQAKEQATNRAETSASGGVIHGGPTVSEAR